MRLRGSIVLILATLAAAGCPSPPREALAPAEDTVAMRPADEPPSFSEPDTTAEAVLAWLEAEQYRETWDPWPGTTPLHSGAEPHGAVLTTYANPVAIEALSLGALAMPPGAVIVLEGYLPDSTLSSVSVMVQAGAFDPERKDWFFAGFGSAGEIEAAGRVESCQGCHVREPDYLFSGELGTPLPVDSLGQGTEGLIRSSGRSWRREVR